MQQTHYLLDTASFTRDGRVFTAQSSISDFNRALDGLPSQDDQLISWSLEGRIDAAGQQFMTLALQGYVVLSCQRCLQDFHYSIDTKNTVLVVANELDLDTDADDPDALERILASPQLNALDLIEDELILSLPYVPRHEVCPDLPQALQNQNEEAEDEKPHPFAVLSQLKKS